MAVAPLKARGYRFWSFFVSCAGCNRKKAVKMQICVAQMNYCCSVAFTGSLLPVCIAILSSLGKSTTLVAALTHRPNALFALLLAVQKRHTKASDCLIAFLRVAAQDKQSKEEKSHERKAKSPMDVLPLFQLPLALSTVHSR